MFKSENILLVMRHASSNLPHYVGRDFERPLDSLGVLQPYDIAEALEGLGITIERAVVSTARRTTQTFEKLQEILAPVPQIFFDARLYQASFLDVIDVLQEHASYCQKLLLIGHNPSVSEIHYQLTKHVYEYKPANLAILRAKRESLALSLDAEFGFSVEQILTPNR